MLRASSTGSWGGIERFLKERQNEGNLSFLDRYGKRGVDALQSSTPRESGETAEAWRYEITKKGHKYTINFCNDHVVNGVNIAVIIQYGHGTRTGGWVEGYDYINPAMQKVFDDLVAEIVSEVTR